MRSRVIENLQKINSVSDFVVTSDEGDNEENDSKRVIKGVFKFKSVTFRFLEIAKDENSLGKVRISGEILLG
ncbi:hypothetical protein [Aeromonas dhakensis]|uniref:hypothetical protein n=1 Tax=Aeromonas dhakensis TaxID=196024 RepID=UPI003985D167